MSKNDRLGNVLSGAGAFRSIFGGKAEAAQAYGQQSSNLAAQQQAMVNQMRAEQAGYRTQAETALGQSPTYTTSDASRQYQALMSGLGSSIGGVGKSLAGVDYTTGGQQALATGYQTATNLANTGAASLRDIMKQGVAESAGYAKTGLETGLKDTQSFVDYYRQQAMRQEMPGQKATEAKMGRAYAEGYKALGQQGGGASGLGAMIDLYSNKAEALSDLGIQAAQYKAQQEQQLGSALQTATSLRAGMYDTAASGSLSRAGALAGAEQTSTGMQTGAYQSQASALGDYALNQQSSAQNQAATLANIYSNQASVQGQGLQQGINEAQTSYEYNQLMPYQNKLNYYMNQISSLNPYAAQSDVYTQQMNNISNLYSLFGKKGVWGSGQI